ncbi:hypothetical protein [Eubacterium sp. CAG:156]|uniref:hypothetical protein n=1 Tax=Eubacterium sp. CAG:156 TaxID=1262880 RepID=UPI0032679635
MKKYEELDITDPFIFAKVMSEKELCLVSLVRFRNWALTMSEAKERGTRQKRRRNDR